MKKVLLLGSGALKIGEAGEFDYSGTQAIKALKEEGVRVILVNPNVATIQTSQGLADRVYFVPVTANFVERVIASEKPEGILLSFGGQTALNCGIELHKSGFLKAHKITILGTPIEAILSTEDRKRFRSTLTAIGVPTAEGGTATTVSQGLKLAGEIGYPLMLRAGFALGGMGSGIAKNKSELARLVSNALAMSPQVQIEESLWGWKEVEYEVVRDCADNCITVCNMENMDPVGVHTGESIVVAPSQTLDDRQYYHLRKLSIDVIRYLRIIGECNIQFAIHPRTGDIRVIEVNARLSRSSALASKATGYPLAYVAAKLALGKTLPELRNSVTGTTSAFFEPSLDYVVVKIPRWDLDKFSGVKMEIGSEMKSVGEVMSIGRTFPEAIQKAARSLSDGYIGLLDPRFSTQKKKTFAKDLKVAHSMRLFTICSALLSGMEAGMVSKLTGIDPWYISQLKKVVIVYRRLTKTRRLTSPLLLEAKRNGFSDEQLALIRGTSQGVIRSIRKAKRITPVTRRIDTMAGEFPAKTNYIYLTYHGTVNDHDPKKSDKRLIVLGAGPYAIGTSVEFDWCAVNTIQTLRHLGRETVMINCNPETVSTDYDYTDVLYFEELTLERILDIWDREQAPIICSVGGQVPNNLAGKLADLHVPILGTKPKDITRAEDRRVFSSLLDSLGISQPRWAKVESVKVAKSKARILGYPVLLRPSFVLSGKAMKVVGVEGELVSYMRHFAQVSKEYPMVMTQYFSGASECDVDGVAKRGKILASELSGHIEPAGIHSGDSTLQLPATTIDHKTRTVIDNISKKIVKALHIHGPFNIQFFTKDETVYVIECNLRSSRSIPFVSKTTGRNLIELATNVILGRPVGNIRQHQQEFIGVKVPQFSFHKLRGADPVLEVEMRSTGEVASFGLDPYEAYFKAILATGISSPTKKAVLVSLGGSKNKLNFLYGCQKMFATGFDIYATEGTALFLHENGITCSRIGKFSDHKPNVMDLFEQKIIDFAVVVSREGRQGNVNGNRVESEGYRMRRAATDAGVPIFTSTETATYFILACSRYTVSSVPIQPLDWYQTRK